MIVENQIKCVCDEKTSSEVIMKSYLYTYIISNWKERNERSSSSSGEKSEKKTNETKSNERMKEKIDLRA